MREKISSKKQLYNKFFAVSLKEQPSKQEVDLCVMPLYQEEGCKRVFEEAKKRKMIPFVASMMYKLHLDETYWQEHYIVYKKRNEKILSELDRVYKRMEERGVKKLFVSENLGALLSSGRDLTLFASGDVDNCSDYSEKDKIYKILQDLGYSIEECMTGHRVAMTSFYHDGVLPDGFHLNICWGALYREKLPDLIDLDEIGAWNNLRNYQDTFIKLPSEEALLYICLLHISLHSYNRKPDLRLYEDIYNVTFPQTVKWTLPLTWANNSGTVTRFVTSAVLSNRLLDVVVPDEVDSKARTKCILNLIELVYSNGYLKPEPNRLQVMNIEMKSCKSGTMCGGG